MTQCTAAILWGIALLAGILAILLLIRLASEISINTSLRSMGHEIKALGGLRRRFITTVTYFILFAIGLLSLANTKTTPCKAPITKPCKCKDNVKRTETEHKRN